MTPADKPLTAGQVANLFGVGANAVHKWAADGKLDCFRTPGGHRRFRPEDVNALLERTSQKNGAPS